VPLSFALAHVVTACRLHSAPSALRCCRLVSTLVVFELRTGDSVLACMLYYLASLPCLFISRALSSHARALCRLHLRYSGYLPLALQVMLSCSSCRIALCTVVLCGAMHEPFITLQTSMYACLFVPYQPALRPAAGWDILVPAYGATSCKYTLSYVLSPSPSNCVCRHIVVMCLSAHLCLHVHVVHCYLLRSCSKG
jgi:hypothetical protein